MAERALMPVSGADGQQRARVGFLQHVDALRAVPFGQNADIRDGQLARIRAARIEQQAVLGAMKRHRFPRMHRVAEHLPGRAIHAGGDIRRDDGQTAFVHALHRGQRRAGKLAAQSRAVKRIDDGRAVLRHFRRFIIEHVERRAAAVEQAGVHAGVALHLRRAFEQPHICLAAALHPQPGRRAPVAAVIAVSADEQHAAAAGRIGRKRIDDCLCRVLHQQNGRIARSFQKRAFHFPHILRRYCPDHSSSLGMRRGAAPKPTRNLRFLDFPPY